jgi:hypothetical protein
MPSRIMTAYVAGAALSDQCRCLGDDDMVMITPSLARRSVVWRLPGYGWEAIGVTAGGYLGYGWGGYQVTAGEATRYGCGYPGHGGLAVRIYTEPVAPRAQARIVH